MSLVDDQAELLELCGVLGADRLKLCTVVKSLLPDCNCPGAFDWDIRTGAFHVSHSWLDMLGYSEADATGKAEFLVDLAHPDDKRNLVEAIYQYLTGLSYKYNITARLRTRAGSFLPVNCSGILICRDALGRPERMVGMHKLA